MRSAWDLSIFKAARSVGFCFSRFFIFAVHPLDIIFSPLQAFIVNAAG
jgi:hypothetical protein